MDKGKFFKYMIILYPWKSNLRRYKGEIQSRAQTVAVIRADLVQV